MTHPSQRLGYEATRLTHGHDHATTMHEGEDRRLDPGLVAEG
jgi:hypothetical protein